MSMGSTFVKSIRKTARRATRWPRLRPVLAILAVTIVGGYLLSTGHAATLAAVAEAENGTLSGSAAKVTDSAASGSSAVAFGTPPADLSNITGVPAGISPGDGGEEAWKTSWATQMAADGVKYFRTDTRCNSYNQNVVSDVENAGLQDDAIILDPCGGQTPAAYATQSTAVVNALKPYGVHIYEVMNEPNGCEYNLTPSAYTAILKASYTAIKAADPSAFVLMAGLCPPDDTADLPYTYLTAMYAAGAKGYFDAMNDHPYSYPDTPLQTSDSWNPWSYLPQLHTIMANNGDGNKQIWLTEFGCPTGTDAGLSAVCTPTTEGQQITDAFQVARGWSWVGPLYIFSWEDSTEDGDFGLYTVNGTAKQPTLNNFTAAAKNP